MGLREQVALDVQTILEDSKVGAGWAVILTDPDGTRYPVTGHSTDISQAIDPDTGQIISSRSASIAFSLLSLPIGVSIKGVTNPKEKPWIVDFDDVMGCSHTFKVCRTEPDRAVGCMVCHLESYKDD